MRILDVAIAHPDGRITDEDGVPLTFVEAMIAKEYRTPDGKDMCDQMYEAGYRLARDRERRAMSAILGTGDKSFGMQEIVER